MPVGERLVLRNVDRFARHTRIQCVGRRAFYERSFFLGTSRRSVRANDERQSAISRRAGNQPEGPKLGINNSRSKGADSHQRLEKDEADHDCLDEKENGIELVIPFVLRDSGRHQPDEIDHTADDVWFS